MFPSPTHTPKTPVPNNKTRLNATEEYPFQGFSDYLKLINYIIDEGESNNDLNNENNSKIIEEEEIGNIVFEDPKISICIFKQCSEPAQTPVEIQKSNTCINDIPSSRRPGNQSYFQVQDITDIKRCLPSQQQYEEYVNQMKKKSGVLESKVVENSETSCPPRSVLPHKANIEAESNIGSHFQQNFDYQSSFKIKSFPNYSSRPTVANEPKSYQPIPNDKISNLHQLSVSIQSKLDNIRGLKKHEKNQFSGQFIDNYYNITKPNNQDWYK
jgi:hypothetical protein